MWKIVAGSVTLGFKGFSQAAGERGQAPSAPSATWSRRTCSLIQAGRRSSAMGVLFFVVAMVTPGDGGAVAYGLAVEPQVRRRRAWSWASCCRFLFTPVAAQAIAIVGVNPVSGMTLITVVLAIGCMILVGLKGTAGMIIALIIGTAVCTALSTSGALITDFKIGYWLGSTPRNQERWKFLGMRRGGPGGGGRHPAHGQRLPLPAWRIPPPARWSPTPQVLPAPQANMIAAVSNGLMGDPANQPWLLYGLGGVIAV